MLYLTTESVFENFGEQSPGFPPGFAPLLRRAIKLIVCHAV